MGRGIKMYKKLGRRIHMLSKRNIANSNDAIVGIVATFLVVGLIVSVLSMIQLVFIPKWMEQNEADHMDTVADQFSQLKFAIDTQSVIKQRDAPIASYITLGNKELPFLSSTRSYGSLEIVSHACSITFSNETDTFHYPLGIIRYSSDNAYYLDQDYLFEAGAVILSQNSGSSMFTKPMFSIRYDTSINISFTIINVSTIGDKREIGGYGTYPIQTEFSYATPSRCIYNLKSLTIETQYQSAWYAFLRNTLVNAGLVSGSDFDITQDATSITVSFIDPVEGVNLNVYVVEIAAQISPGWIENVKGVCR
jgi:hypothetical protein